MPRRASWPTRAMAENINTPTTPPTRWWIRSTCRMRCEGAPTTAPPIAEPNESWPTASRGGGSGGTSRDAREPSTMRNERAWLAAVCASELGTMLVFSNFSALLPLLTKEWDLSNTQAGLILAFYQIGYIAAVAILATLTDYMPARSIYLWSAVWTGLSSLAFAFGARGFLSALVLRGVVGLGLPGMRMVAERFARGGRGFAMGCYIGTFTVGTAISLLLTGWANGLWGWRWAFAVTGLGPLAAGIIGWWVLPRGMAQSAKRAPRAPGLGPVLRNTSALRLIVAYGGHTFELMGMRGWIVPFFTASLVAAGARRTEATQKAGFAPSADVT